MSSLRGPPTKIKTRFWPNKSVRIPGEKSSMQVLDFWNDKLECGALYCRDCLTLHRQCAAVMMSKWFKTDPVQSDSCPSFFLMANRTTHGIAKSTLRPLMMRYWEPCLVALTTTSPINCCVWNEKWGPLNLNKILNLITISSEANDPQSTAAAAMLHSWNARRSLFADVVFYSYTHYGVRRLLFFTLSRWWIFEYIYYWDSPTSSITKKMHLLNFTMMLQNQLLQGTKIRENFQRSSLLLSTWCVRGGEVRTWEQRLRSKSTLFFQRY